MCLFKVDVLKYWYGSLRSRVGFQSVVGFSLLGKSLPTCTKSICSMSGSRSIPIVTKALRGQTPAHIWYFFSLSIVCLPCKTVISVYLTLSCYWCCCCCYCANSHASICWWSCTKEGILIIFLTCRELHPVFSGMRKGFTVGDCYGWIPWALSTVMGSILLCPSLSVSIFLPLSLLQQPGPDRVHCSLHGNCVTLSISLLSSQPPTPPSALLLASPVWLCCSTPVSFYTCIASSLSLSPLLQSSSAPLWDQSC